MFCFVGITWLEVTTDPIELWAAPESRSRIERSFFDETFRPFYRTEQVIIHAKDLPTISYTDYLDENRTFGPIFHKDEFLLPLLQLQEDLYNIEAEMPDGKVIKLQDVCNNPLSRPNSQKETICNIQNIWAYWQDDVELLHNVHEWNERNLTYLDHFLMCAG